MTTHARVRITRMYINTRNDIVYVRIHVFICVPRPTLGRNEFFSFFKGSFLL